MPVRKGEPLFAAGCLIENNRNDEDQQTGHGKGKRERSAAGSATSPVGEPEEHERSLVEQRGGEARAHGKHLSFDQLGRRTRRKDTNGVIPIKILSATKVDGSNASDQYSART